MRVAMNFWDHRPTFEIQNSKKRSPHRFATFGEWNPRPTELLNQYPPAVISPFTLFKISSKSQKAEASVSTLNSGDSCGRVGFKTHGTVFDTIPITTKGLMGSINGTDRNEDPRLRV